MVNRNYMSFQVLTAVMWLMLLLSPWDQT